MRVAEYSVAAVLVALQAARMYSKYFLQVRYRLVLYQATHRLTIRYNLHGLHAFKIIPRIGVR